MKWLPCCIFKANVRDQNRLASLLAFIIVSPNLAVLVSVDQYSMWFESTFSWWLMARCFHVLTGHFHIFVCSFHMCMTLQMSSFIKYAAVFFYLSIVPFLLLIGLYGCLHFLETSLSLFRCFENLCHTWWVVFSLH